MNLLTALSTCLLLVVLLGTVQSEEIEETALDSRLQPNALPNSISGLPNLQEMRATMKKARQLRKRSECLTGILGGNCSGSKIDPERRPIVDNNNNGNNFKNP